MTALRSPEVGHEVAHVLVGWHSGFGTAGAIESPCSSPKTSNGASPEREAHDTDKRIAPQSGTT